jgi:serine/threonine protein kinase
MQPYSRVCNVCGTANHMGRTHCLACGQVLLAPGNSDFLTSAPTLSALSKKLLKQRYRVMHIVGRGGMGVVYIGTDTQLGNRLVAIKEMSQSGLTTPERIEAAKNFQAEAHLLASLQHPHLPSIYDYFEEEQRWYLVMSFIKGQTLASYLEERGGRLPVGEVTAIGIALCSVLDYLHTHAPPIIFRDLKPSNIMRTTDGSIYLIDFGIARFFKPGQVVDTGNQGSPGYASPEQYGTAQTTPRSDIYSLGATLYCLLSGYEPAYNPFRFPPLQSFVSNAPAQLVALIDQMLALDERERPTSAATVKWELQSISESADIAPPQQPSPRPSLFTKSQRGILLSLLLITAVIVSTSLYVVFESVNTRRLNTPYGTVNTFCNAMNSLSPDYLTAYHQLSRSYQQKHSLVNFQEYLLGTTRCTIASAPNSNDQAVISLTLVCPFPPPGGIGAPPPGAPPLPPGGPPPQTIPVDITLIGVGTNDWRIDTLFLVGHSCNLPPN